MMNKNANLSLCGKYRYNLTRIWDYSKKRIVFIGLNPSTADAVEDDATITRLIEFTKSWGYGGFTIVNIYAFRTRYRTKLNVRSRIGDDIYGPENKANIAIACTNPLVDKIICMWGKDAARWDKRDFIDYIKEGWKDKLYCFQKNGDGSPTHPLYLAASTRPIPYS